MDPLDAVLGTLPVDIRVDLERRLLDGKATREERADLQSQMRRAALRPLAYARLWDRDGMDGTRPRTSQRRAVLGALHPTRRRAFLLGGNRSGKSTAAAQVGSALMLGREHPDVQAWCRGNGIPLEWVPQRAGRVYSVALDSGDSIQYVRPEWASWLGPRARWHNREGNGDAWADLDGARVIFKAADQGRDGMQGTNVRAALCDEEPPLDVVNELEMRLVDQRGRLIVSASPLSGWTPLLNNYVRRPAADTFVGWIHGEDNPHVPTEELLQRLARFGPHEQAARRRGEIAALEGRVYVGWSRQVHVAEVEPLQEWPRYMAIDWGTSVPTAMLIGAYDEGSDTLYVLDEVYEEQLTISQRADRIRSLEAKHGATRTRWADPEDASTNRTIALDHGLSLVSAIKDVRHGIDIVGARLAPDVLGRTHLVVHPRCVHLIEEIEAYVWDNTERQTVRKKNDHAVDALRYLCVGIARQAGLFATLRATLAEAAPPPSDRLLRLRESLAA